MKFDWTHGDSWEFFVKLAAWFVWAVVQAAIAGLHDALAGLPGGGAAAPAMLGLAAVAAIWLVLRLIKLMLMGGVVALAGVLALHFLQR